MESQLEAMTKERDEAEKDDSVQLAELRQQLAAKTDELAATIAATAAEDEAAGMLPQTYGRLSARFLTY